MWPSSLILFSAIGLLPHISATSFAPRTLPQLLARQNSFDPSIIPDACKNDCTIAVSTIQTCVPPQPASCGCTLNEERGFVNCMNCILGVGAPTQAVIDQVQSFVDQYVILCNRAGVSLPATTVNGGTSLVTSTAAPPFSSGRSQASASVTRSPTTASRTSSATLINPSPTDDNDEDFSTSQTRIAQSTIASGPSPSDTTSGSNVPLDNAPNSGSSLARGEMWMTAAVAGVALVVLF